MDDDHADGYSSNKLVFQWKNENKALATAQANLHGFKLIQLVSTSPLLTKTPNEYSYLLLNMILKREDTPFLVTVFFPTALLVIVSWISFFISAKNQLLKTMVALISLMTLTISVVILNGRDLPSTSYTKAIDVWTGVCLDFVFFAFLQSIMVYTQNLYNCRMSQTTRHDMKTDDDLKDSSSAKKNVSNNFKFL